VSRDRSEEPF